MASPQKAKSDYSESDIDILEGLESAQAYATLSLDASSGDADEDGGSLADTLGGEDPSLAEVETRQTLSPLLAGLAPRERRIIQMRFYENLTQAQIAERVGVSQMHVSRLLAKSLAQMRTGAELHEAVLVLKKAVDYTQSNVSPAAVCGYLEWALR